MTASSAVLDLGRSVDGSGGGRDRCDDLYVKAEVESSIGGGGFGILSEKRLIDELNPRGFKSDLAARNCISLVAIAFTATSSKK